MTNETERESMDDPDMWIRMYFGAVKDWHASLDAVLTKIAEGGNLADVVDLVGDILDSRDAVDDDAIALFNRAKAKATGDEVTP